VSIQYCSHVNMGGKLNLKIDGFVPEDRCREEGIRMEGCSEATDLTAKHGWHVGRLLVALGPLVILALVSLSLASTFSKVTRNEQAVRPAVMGAESTRTPTRTPTGTSTAVAESRVRRTARAQSRATSYARETAIAEARLSAKSRVLHTAIAQAQSTAASRVRRTATAQSRATDYTRETATAEARLSAKPRVLRTAMAQAQSTAQARATDFSRETDEAEARPTSTPTPPVDDVTFVADVTVPDNTVFSPGENFAKTWRVRNIGSRDWTPAYRLEVASGDRLGAAEGDYVPEVVAGEEADLTVPMVAPSEPGTYTGVWRMVNADGEPVGDQMLSVVIQVPEPPEPTVPPTPSLDFVLIKQDVRTVFIDGGCNWEHNIYVTVIDKYGNPLDGLVVVDTFDNLALTSGSKGPGRVDFDLWGNTYELYVKGDEAGTPYRSAVTRRLSSSHPEIGDMINGGVCQEEAECQDKLDRMSFCFGHYSYDVVFQRTW
jgi:hypothetical protein